MSKYNDQVTILSPTYISGLSHSQTGGHTHSKKPLWFRKVFKSFYKSMEAPYPIHHFKDDSGPKARKELKEFLNSLGANYKFLEGEKTNGFHALIKLIESVKTPYMFFILDDTMMVTKKDFITPCAEAMNKDPELGQIKLGSGFVGEGRDNRKNVIIRKDGTATPNVCAKSIYIPEKLSTGDVVWKMYLRHENILNVFPLSYYNCFMRTSFVKKIHKRILEKGLRNGVDFSDYLVYTNYGRDTSNRINKKGWPKGFEFVEKYKNGWLNFASYVYHLGSIGRSLESAKKFSKTHTHEIHGKL